MQTINNGIPGGTAPKRKMSKEKKILAAVIMAVATVHVPQMALTPGIARMATDAFPQFSLLSIQSAVTLPCLLSVISGVVGAVLIRLGKLTRKNIVVAGLGLYVIASIWTLLFHTLFWQVIISGLFIGSGTGFIVPYITSIMIDDFDGPDLHLVTGLQGSFVGFGGIILSFVAGLLVTVIWFGGYELFFLGLPLLILCAKVLPHKQKKAVPPGSKFVDISPNVVLYSLFASFLFVMTYAVFANNFSSHLQSHGYANFSVLAGTGIAINLLGGTIAGFFYSKLGRAFGDYVIVISYGCLAAGFVIVSAFPGSVPMMYLGAFVAGASLCLATPQGIMSVSRYTNQDNSFFGTLFFNCICNGTAGFLAAPVYTGITLAIAGDDTIFRYYFVAGCSALFGIIFFFIIAARRKKGIAWR
jgi:MFS family permease